MKRLFLSATAIIAIAVPRYAAAQTPPSAAPQTAPAATPSTLGAGPLGGRLSISGIVGAAAVQKVGGLFGGELAYELVPGVDVFGEGVSMQDVVTRRRLDVAQTISNYLQTSQGKAATSTVVAPGSYGGVGVRAMLMNHGMVRPYIAFSFGRAHIAYQPAFTVGGADVTASLSQFGVTLGTDTTGEVTVSAFSGGAGVRYLQPRWFVDGGIRITSIRTADQPTNVSRVSAGVGVKF